MSLPATARHRWGMEKGGTVGYIDLGDCVLVIPGGVDVLRAELLAEISPETWDAAASGFGDPELANQ